MLPTFAEFTREAQRVNAELDGRPTDPHDPFPWQQRLVDEVMQRRAWPDTIDIPTGLGKTSILDIAVYVAAALGVERHSPARRRMFFVIDRRVVVDEAFEHGSMIARALQHADRSPALTEIVSALRRHGLAPRRSTDDRPMVVERMRGGLTWSWNWMNRPDRLAIVVGTVDQLGSRMLFRGYGLGQRLSSIDAALVGNDSLIVVDEAHLAEPLVAAVRSAVALDEPSRPIGTMRPAMVVMSATQRRDSSMPDGQWRFGLGDADLTHPVAARRLRANKQLRLVKVTGSRRLADAMADVALTMAAGRDGAVVGVVCNTVALARQVFDTLSSADGIRRVLLTGRVRPYDRDRNMREFFQDFRLGRSSRTGRPLIVVATQTIEVGVNADFDGLVTQVASWASLVQRFGRLNRAGNAAEADAVVVTDGRASPVYGAAASATWDWLASLVSPAELGPRDRAGLGRDSMSIAVADLAELRPPADVEVPRVETPALGAPQLDAWVRTSPRPVTDPPVEPYLHGFSEQPAEVRVLWRADLGSTESSMKSSIERLPPRAEEVLEVTLAALRNWLTDRHQVDIADTALADIPGSETKPDELPPTSTFDVVRVPTDGEAEIVTVPSEIDHIRPGDLVVVPAAVGGCDRWGWNPTGREPVRDLGDAVRLEDPRSRQRSSVRFLGSTLCAVHGDDPSPDERTAAQQIASAVLAATRADELDDLASLVTSALGPLLRADERVADVALPIEVNDPPHAVVSFSIVTGSSRGHRLVPSDVGSDAGVTGDSQASSMASSALGVPVLLRDHLQVVGDRAREFASALGLEPDLLDVVVTAARWHDVGKLDDRFQLALRGGVTDEFALAGEPLAKSGMDPSDRSAFRRANRLAQVPQGFRHEVGSAQVVARHAAELGVVDVDLLIHLVASHHGHARPLFPVVEDGVVPGHLTVEFDGRTMELDRATPIDWSHPRRFRMLNRKYGRWGLALLETVVRLADIECSKEGT